MAPNMDVKRKKIPTKTRKAVYDKYGGRCAYCGKKIEYNAMQIDHLVPLYWYGGADSEENYMPTCRMCNFYKSTHMLETFRGKIQTIAERLQTIFIYRLALQYGIVEEHKKSITFYFEKEEEPDD